MRTSVITTLIKKNLPKVETREIPKCRFKFIKGFKIPISGTHNYSLESISRQLRPLTTKDCLVLQDNSGKIKGIKTNPLSKFICMFKIDKDVLTDKNFAKVLFALRELNLLKNATYTKEEKPVTQAKIKTLITEYKEKGDKLGARVLQSFNNTRHKHTGTDQALRKMTPSELKKWVNQTSESMPNAMHGLTEFIVTLSNLIRDTANTTIRKQYASKLREQYAHKFKRVYLPKRYKGSTEQTLNIIDKAASNPEMRERLALNKLLYGEVSYHR